MTREEAIKMLKSKMEGNTDTSYEWAETVRMAIKALEERKETVTEFADRCRECGKQKKGKWITKSHGFPLEPTSVCSECGYDRDFYIRTRGFDKIKYCPNCGARMAESEEV